MIGSLIVSLISSKSPLSSPRTLRFRLCDLSDLSYFGVSQSLRSLSASRNLFELSLSSRSLRSLLLRLRDLLSGTHHDLFIRHDKLS
ncbi:hypothetical protein Syun_019421 [Stephania yunnanensis]|uniref:Uncharacterized protein n=1 Tax=Stephania yunnanensis TaxID=152371 RepID=A0AAP0IU85_9MAGN